MKIIVKVIPNAKIEKIFLSDEIYKVWVKGKPKEGEANKAVVKLLAEYFHVSKTSIEIILGHKSHTKIIQIIQ